MTLISRRSVFTLPIVGLLLASPAQGQEVVSPQSIGMSAERLQRITLEAENQITKGNLVGMVSLVARRGKIVYLEAAGRQKREKGVPMRTDTIFRLASFTKPVTSLAVLMLYEEGKIQLTDPVSHYIPAFKDMKVVAADGSLEDARREITIYDLLTHNSGLVYHNHEVVGIRYHQAAIACGLYADKDPTRVSFSKMPKLLDSLNSMCVMRTTCSLQRTVTSELSHAQAFLPRGGDRHRQCALGRPRAPSSDSSPTTAYCSKRSDVSCPLPANTPSVMGRSNEAACFESQQVPG